MTDPRKLLSVASALLLDFDGPICSTFHAYPPARVTCELADAVRDTGAVVPEQPARMGPHDFLAWVGERIPDLVERVELELARIERIAVADAAPTPYAAEVVRAAELVGLPVGIVSNNATEAIERYLELHGIVGVRVVYGRPADRLDRMKPDPWLLRQAASSLGVDLGGCVLVGDSETDVEAARAADVPVIGYATSPDGADELARAGADPVLTSMADLATALTSHGAREVPTAD